MHLWRSVISSRDFSLTPARARSPAASARSPAVTASARPRWQAPGIPRPASTRAKKHLSSSGHLCNTSSTCTQYLFLVDQVARKSYATAVCRICPRSLAIEAEKTMCSRLGLPSYRSPRTKTRTMDHMTISSWCRRLIPCVRSRCPWDSGSWMAASS